MEFPDRVITGVVIQSYVTNALHAYGYEAVVARSMAQGMSMLANKMQQLEFQVAQLSKELVTKKFEEMDLN
jgi:hypothetical protein